LGSRLFLLGVDVRLAFMQAASVTLIGGPTIWIEYAGRTWITDPTFDEAGAEYPRGPVTLRKTTGPALRSDELAAPDFALVSHDQHADNLDNAGRAFLSRAARVVTTKEGASRLGAGAIGLEPWECFEDAGVRITATPARHGPPGCEPLSGPVIGFVLEAPGSPSVYVSGDTVWYEGVEEVARRYRVGAAILFMGAARVDASRPGPVTMTAEEGVQAARAFRDALIVPVHIEGWEHFTESRADVEAVFERAGLGSRLRWPERGRGVRLF
jgi:L-ascorbate metabolism protein UlaG (beta-lactamase superfamily)